MKNVLNTMPVVSKHMLYAEQKNTTTNWIHWQLMQCFLLMKLAFTLVNSIY